MEKAGRQTTFGRKMGQFILVAKWYMDLALIGWTWERNARMFKTKRWGFDVKMRQELWQSPTCGFAWTSHFPSRCVFALCKRLLHITGLLHFINDNLGIVKGDMGFARMSRSVVALAEFTRAASKRHFKTSLSSVLTVSPWKRFLCSPSGGRNDALVWEHHRGYCDSPGKIFSF